MHIIDAHLHFYEPPSAERPWDAGALYADRPPCLIDEVLATAAGAGVSKVVQVTPVVMAYDNRYGFENAQKYPDQVAGVFARFDPLPADMPARLARLAATPGFLGVRLTLNAAPFNRWFDDGTLSRVLAEAAAQRIPVALFAPGQTRALGEAARRHPTTRILIDHMAIGQTDPQPYAQWNHVLTMAELPNVWIKVSYFPTIAREPWPFAAAQRRLRELVQYFGAARLIWGSDFPNSKRICSYRQSVDFIRTEATFLSTAERALILGGSLMRAVERAAQT